MERRILQLPFAASLLLAPALAQQVRVLAPVGAIAPAPRSAEEDLGVPVEMFENPNLDRYLRRAQDLLARENYLSAIEVLQDVIEGRTIEFVEGGAEQPAPGQPADGQPAGGQPAGGKPATDTKPEEKKEETTAARSAATRTSARATAEKEKADKAAAEKKKSLVELDAAKSVFSQDGRLYRPVRRLCHELLARLPAPAIELYRTTYEVAANELLQQALRDGSVSALEQVTNRFFVTLPAGRAMVVLADRLMHEGRYRAAVQVLRDLVEIYPDDNRKKLGTSEVWCRFKIALCLRLAGEIAAAHAAVRDLAAAHPDESLRILGELQAVKDLPQAELFANEVMAVLGERPRAPGTSWLGGSTEALVPLWQYRFKNPEPYREPKATNQNEGIQVWGEGGRLTTMPHAGRYGPATWVAFSSSSSPLGGPHALFFEHFKLRVAEALTGNQIAQGDASDEPPNPRENQPRVRIAACDFALLRPVEDEARRYAVIGHSRNVAAGLEALKASELVAYDRITFEKTWSSSQWLDGEDGLRDVTFLAAPTVFGERLLLPTLRRDAYALQCLDRASGRPLWHTALHAGGTSFWKAPGAPVAVSGGIAFVVTNAGCLAAVDAFAGDLRWIRRYERDDPLRPRPRPRRGGAGEQVYGNQYVQNEIQGFLPNDLIVADGVVVMAPCDGGMLLAIDGASGQPVWMLDAATKYAPYGTLRMLLGSAGGSLFALAEKSAQTSLVCVDLAGGLVRWARELPQWNGPKNSGRGRGALVGDFIVVPGERELLVFDVAGKEPMRRLPLPAFGEGRDPLAGSFHVVSAGPWVALGYPGGVEMFSSEQALRELAAGAADPLLRSQLLVQAGDLRAAADALAAWLADPALDAALRATGAARLVALVRELGLRSAKDGKVGEALAALDAIRPLVGDPRARRHWHLARLEVCKEGGDLRGHEQEQQRLYDFMEGKG